MRCSFPFIPALTAAICLLQCGSAGAQMTQLSNKQLAPPRLVPADSAEKWYGSRPGDRNLRVEIRMFNADSSALSEQHSYGQGEHFGNRTMQVHPLKITVDAVLPDKDGQLVPQVDFTMLRNGQFSVLPQERPMFKLARLEVMKPGEAVVEIPSTPRHVTFTWGKKEYRALRYEILVHVQVCVRPEDGTPLPKPHPFVFTFAYSTQVRADGVQDWQTDTSPVFGITTNWTADSGPSVSIGRVEPAPQQPKLAVGVTLIFFGATIFLWVWASPILSILRRRNSLRTLDPEERFWIVVKPVFDAAAVPSSSGYRLNVADARTIIGALKKYADDQGAGASSKLTLRTMTYEEIESRKQDINNGEAIVELLTRLERSLLREGRNLSEGAAADIRARLEGLVHA
jgi:hypothetical protein